MANRSILAEFDKRMEQVRGRRRLKPFGNSLNSLRGILPRTPKLPKLPRL